MKYVIIFCLTFAFSNTRLSAQYSLSTEKLVPKSSELIQIQDQRYYYPAGQKGKALVYQLNRKGITASGYSAEAALKIHYDEATKKILDSIDVPNKEKKVLRLSEMNDLTVYHGFYQVPSKFQNKLIEELDRGEFLLDYQDIWLEKNGKEFKIKSFPEHYYDKDLEYSIDWSGKYVLVSTFVSEYLRSTKADSIISIFQITNGNLENEGGKEVYCVECVNPKIVGDYIYYSKKFFYLPGADVYDWKTYRAPIFDLSRSELLGDYLELVFVSPDAKYIVGKKYLYGKEIFVILDIKTKKFQYILGRDYPKMKFFYSPAFQQLAFDRENDILYIEYPKQFPFSSIGPQAKRIHTPKKENKVFWEKFTHSLK